MNGVGSSKMEPPINDKDKGKSSVKQSQKYMKAPLPFVGQKRNFLEKFRRVISEHIANDGDGWTIVDVFGGSGLLAHHAKQALPKATVIYNDFDGYCNRIKNIQDTERLRMLLLSKLAHTENKKLLNSSDKQTVIDTINGFDGFVDVKTIASWFLFSGKQAHNIEELFSGQLYNSVPCGELKPATGYLDGVAVTCEPYSAIMAKYQHNANTLFLLDPPYINTNQKAYGKQNYFAMVDFLRLMSLVRPPYIFFSSTKSEILDYFGYMKELNGDDWKRFGGFKLQTIRSAVHRNATYEDNMIFNFSS